MIWNMKEFYLKLKRMSKQAIDNYFLNVAKCGKGDKSGKKWKKVSKMRRKWQNLGKSGKNIENILT